MRRSVKVGLVQGRQDRKSDGQRQHQVPSRFRYWSIADLKVGARAVVEAEGKDMLTATKIHFGTVAAKGSKAKPAQSMAVPHKH